MARSTHISDRTWARVGASTDVLNGVVGAGFVVGIVGGGAERDAAPRRPVLFYASSALVTGGCWLASALAILRGW